MIGTISTCPPKTGPVLMLELVDLPQVHGTTNRQRFHLGGER
jgi:hypothetical protein